MPNTTRASRFWGTSFPDATPGETGSQPAGVALLREQEDALRLLVQEDLSRGRALFFFLSATAVTLVAGMVPAVVLDAVVSETSTTTDVAAAVVTGIVLIAALAVPALFTLCALRNRSVRRFELLRQWAAVDRGPESKFPLRYGTQGYPHGRFFYASLVLVLLVGLGATVLAGLPDPHAFAALPALVVAGAFTWSPISKYAGRYTWSERERAIRGRARRRELHRQQIDRASTASATPPVTPLAGVRIRPALLCAAVISPAVVVTVVFLVVRPERVPGIAVAGLLALAVLVLGLPKVLLVRHRERTELDTAASSLTSGFDTEAAVHPVRFGLGETGTHDDASPTSAWDLAPSRVGALVIDAGTLRLRGTGGASLDLPLAKVQGAVLVPSGMAWLVPSVDVLLRSGEAIEFRSHHAEAIVDALACASVPVICS